MTTKDGDFFIRSGLEFSSTPEGVKAKVPVWWKQFLITWSAICPLVLVIPLVVAPVLRKLGLPHDRFLDTLFATATIVFLMIYLVMPRYTKLLQRWLFN